MFRETKDLEALTYGLEDDFFKGTFRVLAELARVGVVTMRHYGFRSMFFVLGGSEGLERSRGSDFLFRYSHCFSRLR